MVSPVYEAAVVGARGFLGGAAVRALRAAGIPTAEYTLDDPLVVEGRIAEEAQEVRTVVWAAATITPVMAAAEPERVEKDVAALEAALDALDVEGTPARVLLLSSGGTVYGPPEVPPFSEDDPLHPVGPYGKAKLRLEGVLARYSRESTCFRVANAYGPGQAGSMGQGVLGFWLRAIARGEPVTIFGDPESTRDYVYVDDIGRAVVSAHVDDAGWPVAVNVGTGVPTSLAQLLDVVRTVTARDVEVVYQAARSVDTTHTFLDVSRAREIFGWEPRVSLAEGVAEMWSWVLHQQA